MPPAGNVSRGKSKLLNVISIVFLLVSLGTAVIFTENPVKTTAVKLFAWTPAGTGGGSYQGNDVDVVSNDNEDDEEDNNEDSAGNQQSSGQTSQNVSDVGAGEFGWCYSCNNGQGGPATENTWNDPNAEIAGTYTTTGPNGETLRFIIDLPDTQNAAVNYNAANNGILNGVINDPSSPSNTLMFATQAEIQNIANLILNPGSSQLDLTSALNQFTSWLENGIIPQDYFDAVIFNSLVNQAASIYPDLNQSNELRNQAGLFLQALEKDDVITTEFYNQVVMQAEINETFKSALDFNDPNQVEAAKQLQEWYLNGTISAELYNQGASIFSDIIQSHELIQKLNSNLSLSERQNLTDQLKQYVDKGIVSQEVYDQALLMLQNQVYADLAGRDQITQGSLPLQSPTLPVQSPPQTQPTSIYIANGQQCSTDSECGSGYCGVGGGGKGGARSICAVNPGVIAIQSGQNIPNYGSCQSDRYEVTAACNYETYQTQTGLNTIILGQFNPYIQTQIQLNSMYGEAFTSQRIYNLQNLTTSASLGITAVGELALLTLGPLAAIGVPSIGWAATSVIYPIITSQATLVASNLLNAYIVGATIHGVLSGPGTQAYQNAESIILGNYAASPEGFMQMFNNTLEQIYGTGQLGIYLGKNLATNLNSAKSVQNLPGLPASTNTIELFWDDALQAYVIPTIATEAKVAVSAATTGVTPNISNLTNTISTQTTPGNMLFAQTNQISNTLLASQIFLASSQASIAQIVNQAINSQLGNLIFGNPIPTNLNTPTIFTESSIVTNLQDSLNQTGNVYGQISANETHFSGGSISEILHPLELPDPMNDVLSTDLSTLAAMQDASPLVNTTPNLPEVLTNNPSVALNVALTSTEAQTSIAQNAPETAALQPQPEVPDIQEISSPQLQIPSEADIYIGGPLQSAAREVFNTQSPSSPLGNYNLTSLENAPSSLNVQVPTNSQNKLFEFGGNNNILAQGVEAAKGGRNNLFSIMVDGIKSAGDGKPYIGLLTDGDSAITSGPHGPYYVVLKPTHSSVPINGISTILPNDHEAYLVPTLEEKELMLKAISEALEKNIITPEHANSLSSKLFTYDEYLSNNAPSLWVRLNPINTIKNTLKKYQNFYIALTKNAADRIRVQVVADVNGNLKAFVDPIYGKASLTTGGIDVRGATGKYGLYILQNPFTNELKSVNLSTTEVAATINGNVFKPSETVSIKVGDILTIGDAKFAIEGIDTSLSFERLIITSNLPMTQKGLGDTTLDKLSETLLWNQKIIAQIPTVLAGIKNRVQLPKVQVPQALVVAQEISQIVGNVLNNFGQIVSKGLGLLTTLIVNPRVVLPTTYALVITSLAANLANLYVPTNLSQVVLANFINRPRVVQIAPNPEHFIIVPEQLAPPAEVIPRVSNLDQLNTAAAYDLTVPSRDAYYTGDKMQELYEWYKAQPEGWWITQTGGEFNKGHFLAAMLVAEATGGDVNLLKAIIEATKHQLWDAGNPYSPTIVGRDRYCYTADCQGGGGLFNFEAAYLEVARRRYDAFVATNASPKSVAGFLKDSSYADKFAQEGYTLERIANELLLDPQPIVWNKNVPSGWGNRMGWAYRAAGSENLGTTDDRGLVYASQGDFVYTDQQQSYWRDRVRHDPASEGPPVTVPAPFESSGPSGSTSIGSPQQLANGDALYSKFQSEGTNKFTYHVVSVDLADAQFILNPPTNRTSPKGFLEDTGAIVAINADGYDYFSAATAGPTMVDGITYQSVDYEQSLYFDKDGKLITEIVDGVLSLPLPRRIPDNAVGQISFPNLLVNGGKRLPITASDGGVNSRTFWGITKDGKVIFGTIDGKQYENGLGYQGATIRDVQDILIEKGAVIGVNFDGGGSTSMAARTNNGNSVVLNTPDSESLDGQSIASLLGVKVSTTSSFTPAVPAGSESTRAEIINKNYPVFNSQVAAKWDGTIPVGQGKVANQTCSVFFLSNSVQKDPIAVWLDIKEVLKINHIKQSGLPKEDVLKMLDFYGRRTVEITEADKIAKIREYTNAGIPIYVNSYSIRGIGAHHLMVVGVTENGDFITYDSAYEDGMNRILKFEDILDKDTWSAYAVYPPGVSALPGSLTGIAPGGTYKTNSLIGFLPTAVVNTLTGPVAAIWTNIPGLGNQIQTFLEPGTWRYGIDAVRNSWRGFISPEGKLQLPFGKTLDNTQQRVLQIVEKANFDLTPGRIIKMDNRYYQATTNNGVVPVIGLVQTFEALGSFEYPNNFTNGIKLAFDNASQSYYYISPQGEKISIPDGGLLFDDGTLIIKNPKGEGVVWVKFNNEIYNYRDTIFVRYRNGKLFVDNENKDATKVALWLKNGTPQTSPSTEITIGDIVTFPDGDRYLFEANPYGVNLVNIDNQNYSFPLSDIQKFRERIVIANNPDLINFVNSRLEEAGLPKMNKYLSYYDGETNLLDTDIVDDPLFFLGGFSPSSHHDMVARQAILEYLLPRDPEFASLYKKWIATRKVNALIGRYDYEIKFYVLKEKKIGLLPPERDYLELTKKIKRMWELVSSYSPEAKQYIADLVDSLDPNTKNQIFEVVDKLQKFEVDDPLVQSYLSGIFFLPAINQYSELYYLANFAEKALVRQLVPSEGLSAHKTQMNEFWSTVFEQTGINRPKWFNSDAFRGDELSWHTQANSPTETIAANASGQFFMNGGWTADSLAHILNHEATHPILRQESGPRRIGKITSVKSTEIHNEIVVEFLAQMISRGVPEYPPKRAYDLLYQEGVEELVEILKNIDSQSGQQLLGLKLLIQGVVDYNSGTISFPLEYVQKYYDGNVKGKDNFSTRLSQYEDSVYKSTTSNKKDAQANLIPNQETSAMTVLQNGIEYKVEARGGIIDITTSQPPTSTPTALNGLVGGGLPAGVIRPIVKAVTAPLTVIWTGIPGLTNQIQTLLQPGTWRYGIDALRNIWKGFINPNGRFQWPIYKVGTQPSTEQLKLQTLTATNNILAILPVKDGQSLPWTYDTLPKVQQTQENFVYLYRGVDAFDPAILQTAGAFRNTPTAIVADVAEAIKNNSNLDWNSLYKLHKLQGFWEIDKDLFISATKLKEEALHYPLVYEEGKGRFLITIRVPKAEYNKMYTTHPTPFGSDEEVMIYGYIKPEWIYQVENTDNGKIVFDGSNNVGSVEIPTPEFAKVTDTDLLPSQKQQYVDDNFSDFEIEKTNPEMVQAVRQIIVDNNETTFLDNSAEIIKRYQIADAELDEIIDVAEGAEPSLELGRKLKRFSIIDYEFFLGPSEQIIDPDMRVRDRARRLLWIAYHVPNDYARAVTENAGSQIQLTGFSQDPNTADISDFLTQTFGDSLLSQTLISAINYKPNIVYITTNDHQYELPMDVFQKAVDKFPNLDTNRYRAYSNPRLNLEPQKNRKFIPLPINVYNASLEPLNNKPYLAGFSGDEKFKRYLFGTVAHETGHHLFEYVLDDQQRSAWKSIVDSHAEPITEYTSQYQNAPAEWYEEWFTESIRIKSTNPGYLAKNYPDVDRFLTQTLPTAKWNYWNSTDSRLESELHSYVKSVTQVENFIFENRMPRNFFGFLFSGGATLYLKSIQQLSLIPNGYASFMERLQSLLGNWVSRDYNFWRWQLTDFAGGAATAGILEVFFEVVGINKIIRVPVVLATPFILELLPTTFGGVNTPIDPKDIIAGYSGIASYYIADQIFTVVRSHSLSIKNIIHPPLGIVRPGTSAFLTFWNNRSIIPGVGQFLRTIFPRENSFDPNIAGSEKGNGESNNTTGRNFSKKAISSVLYYATVRLVIDAVNNCTEGAWWFQGGRSMVNSVVDLGLGYWGGQMSQFGKNDGDLNGPAKANRNPNQRPATDVVAEAIKLYERSHPNSRVVWDRSPDFLSQIEIAQAFTKPVVKDSEIYIIMKSACDQKLAVQMIGEPVYKLYTDHSDWILDGDNSNNDNYLFCNQLVGAEVIYNHLYETERNTDLVYASGYESLLTHENLPAESSSPDPNQPKFSELTKKIEETVSQSGEPVSASSVILYFLELDNGDLDLALINTANYLKYQARYHKIFTTSLGYPTEGPTLTQSANWMQAHILDEYSSYLSYQELPKYSEQDLASNEVPELDYPVNGLINNNPQYSSFVDMGYKDYSLINRVGTPYHVFSLLALLHSTAPEILEIGVLGQRPAEYGLIRWGDEVSFLGDVFHIENYLNSYNPNPREYPSCQNEKT